MTSQLLLILTLIFGITPNLGFFSFSSFFLMTAFGILAWIILRNKLRIKENSYLLQWGILFILLISAYYYGGYYQSPLTLLIGQIVFFSFCIYIFTRIYQKNGVSSSVCLIIFIVLSLLTIYGSPNPTVDSFVILKEAPQKLMQGLNPYNSLYSRVYKNIEPNYFNYLPFSIIYNLPFVLLFGDPRFGIVAAMIGTYWLINKLQKKNCTQKYLYSSLFLFAPRSFYMIEHAYLDTVIFFLFVLAYFFAERKQNTLFAVILSCFFLLKQNILILFPLFLKAITRKREFILLFIIPFSLLLIFFCWDPAAFIKMTIGGYQFSEKFLMISPTEVKIVVPNFLFQLFHFSVSQMKIVYSCCAAIAFVMIVIVYFTKKININRKIVLILFFGYFFSYHAFFNSYYLVLLFLLFDFVLSKE